MPHTSVAERGFFMKYQRHKRKESFSILLVSHTSGSSRQLHFSQTVLRLLLILTLIFCALLGWLIWQLSSAKRVQRSLQSQLNSQLEITRQLESEKESLTNEKKALEKKNMDMLIAAGNAAADTDDTETEAEPEASSSFPGLYPSSETGMIIDIFSEERPYLSINTHIEDRIIAAGDGTVVAISSDDTYPIIIEIEHESGHRTRYMCRQDADKNAEIGAKVLAGDTLITITADNTQLDYQVVFEGEVIDPFNVIDAKG